MFDEVELVSLTFVHASVGTRRQCKPAAAGKIMMLFFCRRYLASRHHLDSYYPLCLLPGVFVQNMPEENSRYLACFL